jgi:hypothetical protein
MARALIGPGMPFIVAAAMLFVCGAARSMELTSLTTLVYADVDDSLRTGANTLATVITQLSGSLGVALGAAVLGGSSALRKVNSLELIDFRFAFVVMGLMAFPAAIAFARLPRDAGAEVSGHRRSAA